MDENETLTIRASEFEAWVRELQGAFAPYPAFVEEVARRLRELEAEAERPIAPSRKKSQSLPERRVLLLDDAELNRVLISHYLRGLPVKLDFASALEGALGLCGSYPYDLLLVDVELKGSVPADLVRTLRQGSPGARIVALGSSDRDPEEGSTALSAGFQGYFPRGLSREALVSGLSAALWPET